MSIKPWRGSSTGNGCPPPLRSRGLGDHSDSSSDRLAPVVRQIRFLAWESPGRDRTAFSISLDNKIPVFKARLVVLFVFVGPFGQLDRRPVYFLERDPAEDVRNAIEPRPPLVVRSNDVPGRVFA